MYITNVYVDIKSKMLRELINFVCFVKTFLASLLCLRELISWLGCIYRAVYITIFFTEGSLRDLSQYVVYFDYKLKWIEITVM